MAWSSPPVWSVSQVVTAAQMTILSDDLNYLKGNTSAVDIVQTVNLKPASGTPELGMYLPASSGNTQAVMYDQTATYRGIFGYAGSTYATTTMRNCCFFITNGASGDFLLMPNGVEAARFQVGGNVGIGTQAPSGKLHVTSAGGIAAAGMVIGSVAAVTSLQTVFAAGTVSRAAWFFAFDRNNTGGALFAYNAAIPISTSTNYINTDTITIAITAGGAVTAQRTSGTNGTHDIVLFLFLM